MVTGKNEGNSVLYDEVADMIQKLYKSLIFIMLPLLLSNPSYAARPGGSGYHIMDPLDIGRKTLAMSQTDIDNLPLGITWHGIVKMFKAPYYTSLIEFSWAKKRKDIDFQSDGWERIFTNSYFFIFDNIITSDGDARLTFVASFDTLADYPDIVIPDVMDMMTINWPPFAAGMTVGEYVKKNCPEVTDGLYIYCP